MLLAGAAAGRRNAAIDLAIGAGPGAAPRRLLAKGAWLGAAAALGAWGLYAWARVWMFDITLLPTLSLRLQLPEPMSLLPLIVLAGTVAGVSVALGPALWAGRQARNYRLHPDGRSVGDTRPGDRAPAADRRPGRRRPRAPGRRRALSAQPRSTDARRSGRGRQRAARVRFRHRAPGRRGPSSGKPCGRSTSPGARPARRHLGGNGQSSADRSFHAGAERGVAGGPRRRRSRSHVQHGDDRVFRDGRDTGASRPVLFRRRARRRGDCQRSACRAAVAWWRRPGPHAAPRRRRSHGAGGRHRAQRAVPRDRRIGPAPPVSADPARLRERLARQDRQRAAPHDARGPGPARRRRPGRRGLLPANARRSPRDSAAAGPRGRSRGYLVRRLRDPAMCDGPVRAGHLVRDTAAHGDGGSTRAWRHARRGGTAGAPSGIRDRRPRFDRRLAAVGRRGHPGARTVVRHRCTGRRGGAGRSRHVDFGGRRRQLVAGPSRGPHRSRQRPPGPCDRSQGAGGAGLATSRPFAFSSSSHTAICSRVQR